MNGLTGEQVKELVLWLDEVKREREEWMRNARRRGDDNSDIRHRNRLYGYLDVFEKFRNLGVPVDAIIEAGK